MEIVKWDDDLSVDIQEIDDQHKQLIVIINNFFIKLKEQTIDKELEVLFKNLDDYSHYHFDTEEKYMKKFNYKGTDEHVREHQEFIDTIGQLKELFDQNQVHAAVETISFLKSWLLHHIMGTDQNFSECFHENGLK